MAVAGAQVALTANTPAPLNVLDSDAMAGQSIAITFCANDIFLGGSGVATGTGAKVPAGTPISVDLDPREVLYAVCAANTTVHVLHQGQ